MSFTNRLENLKPEGAYAVITKAQALESDGRHIVHLEIGQSDFDTFSHISQPSRPAKHGTAHPRAFRVCAS